MEPFAPFERPIEGVERALRRLAWRIRQGNTDVVDAYRFEWERRQRLRHSVYGNLTPWQRVQLARHPRRPHGLEAARVLFGPLEPLRGDRTGGNDPAIETGVGRWRQNPVVVIACERGRGQREERRRNFGMPSPGGFRQARRALELAERWSLPVVSLVDTPGAYPGVESERLGVAEAISRLLWAQARVKTPTLAIVLGEGGSGGALALAMGDRLLMMQYAYFSVISPEACASILWRDGAKTATAADKLHLLPEDLLGLDIIDEIVTEPSGGAHRSPVEAVCTLRETVDRQLADLTRQPLDTLLKQRFERYRTFESELPGATQDAVTAAASSISG